MAKKLDEYSGVSGIVYLDEIPKKFAIVKTKRGYSLPGGGIEKGDVSLESAIHRELKEELGFESNDFDITETNIKEKFNYDQDKPGRENQYVIRQIFLVKSKTKTLAPKDNDILDVSWCTYEEAKDILTWQNSKETLTKVLNMIK